MTSATPQIAFSTVLSGADTKLSNVSSSKVCLVQRKKGGSMKLMLKDWRRTIFFQQTHIQTADDD